VGTNFCCKPNYHTIKKPHCTGISSEVHKTTKASENHRKTISLCILLNARQMSLPSIALHSYSSSHNTFHNKRKQKNKHAQNAHISSGTRDKKPTQDHARSAAIKTTLFNNTI
jgi:hypothetical protein